VIAGGNAGWGSGLQKIQNYATNDQQVSFARDRFSIHLVFHVSDFVAGQDDSADWKPEGSPAVNRRRTAQRPEKFLSAGRSGFYVLQSFRWLRRSYEQKR
jgi:hypothetical protein